MFGGAKQPKGRSLPNPALAAVTKAAASDGPRKTQSTRVVSPRAAIVAPGHGSQNTEAAAIQARAEAAKARINEAALKPAVVVTVATAAAPAPAPAPTPAPAPAPVAPAEPAPKLAKLLYKQEAKTDAEISVDEGETVVVLTDDNEDWWLVRHGTLEGYVPRAYLEVLPAPAPVAADAGVSAASAPHTNGAAKTSTSKPAATATGDAPKQPKTNEERRVLVAEEILETERSYYKSLEAIVKVRCC